MRPVSSAAPIARLRASDLVREETAALPEATHVTSAPPFEQVLRAALAALRDSTTRVEEERDPLTRHLGFRALNREVEAQSLDPEQLSRDDERAYARALLQLVRGREAETLLALDAAARLDLEVLLQVEQRAAVRARHSLEARTAKDAQADARATVERLESARAKFEWFAHTQPPAWLRLCGVGLALAAVTAFLLLVRAQGELGAWLAGHAPLRWSTALGALVLAGGGGWLGQSPQQRRWWLRRRLVQLAESTRTAAAREAEASEALLRARKLFEAVDAECRREEAATLAVLQRRPGAQRYVSLGGPPSATEQARWS